MPLVRFQVRGRTSDQWAALNEVLLVREQGLETDTRRVKYGDGETAWNALPYAGSAALDYLATNFTPTLLIGGSSTGIAYTTQSGRLTRIGRQITAQVSIVLSSKGAGTGVVAISGLTVANAAGLVGGGSIIVSSVSNFTGPCISIPPGATTINLLTFNGAALAQATAANLTNASEIYITATYTA